MLRFLAYIYNYYFLLLCHIISRKIALTSKMLMFLLKARVLLCSMFLTNSRTLVLTSSTVNLLLVTVLVKVSVFNSVSWLQEINPVNIRATEKLNKIFFINFELIRLFFCFILFTLQK